MPKIIKTRQGDMLTLGFYKEPLKKVPKGHGFMGALLGTVDGSKVQCHICGKLLDFLPGHIYNTHKIKSKEYREMFQLAKSTALASENYRAEMKRVFLEKLKAMSEEEREAYRERARIGRSKRGRFQPKITLETLNKRGTCPDQLLDKIIEVKNRLGRVPSKHEFIYECKSQRYIHLIYKTYGSWVKALQILGMQPKKQQNAPGSRKKKYSPEELIEYMRIYAMENQKKPTYTDFKRGLLPHYGAYINTFGDIESARRAAGIYNLLPETEKP